MLMMKKVGGVCDSHTFRRANTHSVRTLSVSLLGVCSDSDGRITV